MGKYVVDRARWSQLSIIEQMANIGAETGRALNAKREGKEARMRSAAMRALDLFDATEEAQMNTGTSRLREISKARTLFLTLLLGPVDDEFESESAALNRYFTQYANAVTYQK